MKKRTDEQTPESDYAHLRRLEAEITRKNALLRQAMEALRAVFPYAQQGRPSIILGRGAIVTAYLNAIDKHGDALAAITKEMEQPK